MKFRLNKKSVIAGAVVGTLMGLTITAVAYWTATGSTTGTATTGNSSDWIVTHSSTTGTLFPGGAPVTVNYRVTNPSSAGGHQGVESVVVTVKDDGLGNVVVADSADVGTDPDPVVGCLASWFSVTDNFIGPVNLAPGASTDQTSSLSLDNEPAVNQDDCKSKVPLLNIAAS